MQETRQPAAEGDSPAAAQSNTRPRPAPIWSRWRGATREVVRRPLNWPGLGGVLLVLSVGVLLLFSKSGPGRTFARDSYDWLFDLSLLKSHEIQNPDVVLIYLDEDSHKTLGQPFNQPWDRALHARLLDRLTAERARAVVFDIVFSDPGPSESADAQLAAALRRNGHVILAADAAYSGSATGPQATAGLTITRPNERFRTNAAGWGLAMLELEQEHDFTVRRHFNGFADRQMPSMSWKLAEILGLPAARAQSSEWLERWVNYYDGPSPKTLPFVSYAQALHSLDEPEALDAGGVARGFFTDKIVFIGARPITGTFNERRDELRSPFSSWDGARGSLFMPSVLVHATQTLNLIRGDWLTRLSPAAELGLLFVAAVVFGFGLLRFRPLTALAVAAGGAALFLALELALFWYAHVWFPWLIVVTVQIPIALLWCIGIRSLEWYVQRRRLEQERRRADQQIREQAALLDKAQDAIIVHDLDWRASFWNKSAERIYGWCAGEVLAKDLAELMFNGEAARLAQAKDAVVGTGEWLGELKQKTKAGPQITVQSRWSLVRDATGRPSSILVINTDVTEQKKLEAQFLRAQRMESIGTLAGGIAHDLNNVLAPIVMGAELLRSKVADESGRKLLTTMSSSARRGSDMVKQVLSFARGHDGERTALQLSHLIKEMQKIAKETFPKSIEVQTELAPNLWTIMGDATQWHQVLLNLCVNARDAMPDGGKIILAARNVTFNEADAKRLLGAKPGNYLHLSSTDTGTGIPPEIIDKIFEPFFTTKEVGKGTGLGLSTVISIIKGHSAVLDLQSEVGKGTTFNIYIPAQQNAVAAQASEVPRENLLGHGERVLVVDDELPILQVFKDTLAEHGYEVLVAANGEEALSVAAQENGPIALALVDVMMPVMDGVKTIRALSERQPGLRFVAMSGLNQNEQARAQLEGKIEAFLPKPMTSEKLLLTLRSALEPSPPEPLSPRTQ